MSRPKGENSLLTYMHQHSLRLTKEQRALADYTFTLTNGGMMGAMEVGQHFQMLLKILNARRCLEVGCFTGYTALTLALALPENGEVVTCDVTDQYAQKQVWAAAKVANKINLIVGPAVDTLDSLIRSGQSDTFDFAFIDADKSNYKSYFEQCMQLVRRGGIIAIDNVLWGGRVLDPNQVDEDTMAIKALNVDLKNDPRIEISMLNIGDGVTFCLKK